MQDAQGLGKRDAITNHYSLLSALSALREAAGVAFAATLSLLSLSREQERDVLDYELGVY